MTVVVNNTPPETSHHYYTPVQSCVIKKALMGELIVTASLESTTNFTYLTQSTCHTLFVYHAIHSLSHQLVIGGVMRIEVTPSPTC